MESFLSSIVGNGDVIAVLIAAVLMFERVGKLIPDDATGFLALVRMICKLGGAYVRNRETPHDSI